MATSGQSIWFSLGNKSVRDYRHSAQLFRSNDFARAPKYKFLFYVTFNINQNARSDQFTDAPEPVGPNELNYLVKSVEMPKFELDVQPLNQYNKVVHVQRNIRYSPINIKFHDDNIGSLRNFWQSYYNYYFADGSYEEMDYYTDDRYNEVVKSRWGLDTGSKEPYLSNIEIYSLRRGLAQKITIHNPMIVSFNHDTHDYAASELLEASMQLRYSGVTYEDAIDAVFDIEGFGQDAFGTYDTTMSPITSGDVGLQVNFATGQIADRNVAGVSNRQKSYSNNSDIKSQTANYRLNNAAATANITNKQINSVLRNTNDQTKNTGYVFPTTTLAKKVNQEYGAVQVTSQVAYSNNQNVLRPDQLSKLYPTNSWQNNLFEKGFAKEEISSAEKYINEKYTDPSTAPNLQAEALAFLANKSNNPEYNFGHPKPLAPLINGRSNTAAVYDGFNIEKNLIGLGYTKEQITLAQRHLDSILFAPSTNLTPIAIRYLQETNNTVFRI